MPKRKGTFDDMKDDLAGIIDYEPSRRTKVHRYVDQSMPEFKSQSLADRGPRKRLKETGSRQRLVQCLSCSYKVRVTSKWIGVGIPKCPNPECARFDDVMNAE